MLDSHVNAVWRLKVWIPDNERMSTGGTLLYCTVRRVCNLQRQATVHVVISNYEYLQCCVKPSQIESAPSSTPRGPCLSCPSSLRPARQGKRAFAPASHPPSASAVLPYCTVQYILHQGLQVPNLYRTVLYRYCTALLSQLVILCTSTVRAII